MKKTFIAFLATATLVALAAPATGAPGGTPGKPVKPVKTDVAVSIESNLYTAHEVGDLIVFTIEVTNDLPADSGVVLTVTDTLAGDDPIENPLGTVAPGITETFVSDYYVVESDFVDPAVVIDRAMVFDPGGTLVASASAGTGVIDYEPEFDFAYEPCVDETGNFKQRPEGYSVCIWQPSAPGAWELVVQATRDPDTKSKAPISILMNLRDHVPGNWCPLEPESVKWRGEGDPPPITFTVKDGIPARAFPNPGDWHGEAICPNGGAGGDFFDVGTPGSFYLATYDDYQITAVQP